MEFHVLYDDENKAVYDFEKRDFIPMSDVNIWCFLPNIEIAYKIINKAHLFLSRPSEGALKPKKVNVDVKGEVDKENRLKYETSWV